MSSKHTAAFLSRFAWALYALAGVLGLVWLAMNYTVLLAVWFVLSVPMTLLFLALVRSGRDEP